MAMMNSNDIALILIAFFNFLGIAVGGYFAYKANKNAQLSSVRAQSSLDASQKNAVVLEIVKEAAVVSAAATVVNAANSKANSNALEQVKRDVKTVEVATNSMKDELVKVTAAKSFAEGVKSEIDKHNE